MLCWRQLSLEFQLVWELCCVPACRMPSHALSSSSMQSFLSLWWKLSSSACLYLEFKLLLACMANTFPLVGPLSVLDSMLWARALRKGWFFLCPSGSCLGEVSQPPASLGKADKKKIPPGFFSLCFYELLRLFLLLLPQFALQCGNLLEMRADKPIEGRVIIKEFFSDHLSQVSSAKTALIHTVQFESFL